MQLPNGHLAVITDDKLIDYILNESHPANPGHAELFRRLLGVLSVWIIESGQTTPRLVTSFIE